MGVSEADRYAAVYLTEHPELERSTRTGHVAGLAILFWYGVGAMWNVSVWALLQAVFYSALAAKGAHAWQRWQSVRLSQACVSVYGFVRFSVLYGVQVSQFGQTALKPRFLRNATQEGCVDCSCKHCLWSLEGARNPSLALACEWEAAKEVLAYVRATTVETSTATFRLLMVSIDLIDGSCLRRFASLQPFESYPAYSLTIRSPHSRLFVVGLVSAGGDRWKDELPHEAALRPGDRP